MDTIKLEMVYPKVFTEDEVIDSSVWNKKIELQKTKKYLIKASSGKGKSSFCNFVYGTRKDYNGIISFDNLDTKIFNSTQWDLIRQNKLSFVFQDLQLFSELTTLENIELKNNLTKHKKIDEIEYMLESLGISNKKNESIATMSYGQQQRVAIIRALCQPFNFLLLDEPTSHLDDQNAQSVAKLVSEEVEKQNACLTVMSIGKDLPIDYDKTFDL